MTNRQINILLFLFVLHVLLKSWNIHKNGAAKNRLFVPKLLFGGGESRSIKSFSASPFFHFDGSIAGPLSLYDIFLDIEKHLHFDLELHLGAVVHRGINGYCVNRLFRVNHLAQQEFDDHIRSGWLLELVREIRRSDPAAQRLANLPLRIDQLLLLYGLVDEESLFDELEFNGEINKGITSLSELNGIPPVNEPVIVMVLTEDLSNDTSIPQSVAMALGSESVAASAITNPIEEPARNPLEDPPPSRPLMSIWDDKEHILKIEISGFKSWKCNWYNFPPDRPLECS